MHPKGNFRDEKMSFSFLRELTGKKKESDNKQITNDSKSDEISDIISNKLLKSIKEQLTS